jgi:hypothetical protein
MAYSLSWGVLRPENLGGAPAFIEPAGASVASLALRAFSDLDSEAGLS